MIYLEIDNSNGKHVMSMVSTEMSIDMHKLLMRKSFLYLRNTSEMFWKELQLQSTPISVFQNMLSYSPFPRHDQRYTIRMKSMRCSQALEELKNGKKKLSRSLIKSTAHSIKTSTGQPK